MAVSCMCGGRGATRAAQRETVYADPTRAANLKICVSELARSLEIYRNIPGFYNLRHLSHQL